jgi:hypothetical protein
MNQGSAEAVSQTTLITTFTDKFYRATQLYYATQTPLAPVTTIVRQILCLHFCFCCTHSSTLL